MKKFFIITNKTKDYDETITKEVVSFVEANGCTVTGSINFISNNDDICNDELQEALQNTECIIVLGGDGTMLRASRKLYNYHIPFIGINLGHLGYLTEGKTSDIKTILNKVINNDFYIEERMLVAGEINSNRNIALNDITLSRNNSLRMFSFNLHVNGSLLYTYNADGIVVSTPTGSTAYNLSLGGPIATPTSKLLLVTPIAPHSLNNRSLVLSADDELEIELLGSEDDLVDYLVYFDGDLSYKINKGDRIRIKKENEVVRLIRLSSESFLETLKEKMQ